MQNSQVLVLFQLALSPNGKTGLQRPFDQHRPISCTTFRMASSVSKLSKKPEFKRKNSATLALVSRLRSALAKSGAPTKRYIENPSSSALDPFGVPAHDLAWNEPDVQPNASPGLSMISLYRGLHHRTASPPVPRIPQSDCLSQPMTAITTSSTLPATHGTASSTSHTITSIGMRGRPHIGQS